MRPLPAFPSYNVAHAPDTRRWLAVGSLLVLLVGGGIALRQGVQAGVGNIITGMFIILSIMLVIWLFYMLYYRCSVHHAMLWQRTVQQEYQRWWYLHRQCFALCEVVLIGPAGAELSDWLRLLKREQPQPGEWQEAQGKALRVARTFSPDVDEREKQLARMLVLQWKGQSEGKTISALQRCYWQGSATAWQAFVVQMKASFPAVVLPEQPEPWQGELTLATLAASLSSAESDALYLVAGCQSLPPSSGCLRPAGESAVLWLAGSGGPVKVCRGEVFDPSASESLPQVCKRAQRQSELDASPDTCILFSQPQPQQSALAGSGWNVTHHLQDSYWGELGQLEPLVVLSLAAIFAHHQDQSCAWIATDPLHTFALGIVKPYGKG